MTDKDPMPNSLKALARRPSSVSKLFNVKINVPDNKEVVSVVLEIQEKLSRLNIQFNIDSPTQISTTVNGIVLAVLDEVIYALDLEAEPPTVVKSS